MRRTMEGIFLLSRKSQRGASIILFTLLMAFVIVPIMGLGIDASIQYWVKAKLSTAVDASALAAARSLNVGASIVSQTSNAQAVGRQYFTANFPTGVLGTTVIGGQDADYPNSPTITVAPSTNSITISVNAQVRTPLYFMSILHFSSGSISASGQSTRRDANIILVLDRSGSMNNNGNCGALIQDVQNFAGKFIDGRDRLGLVTFSTAAKADYLPTLRFKTASTPLSAVIGSMFCVGATSTEQGLKLGYDQIKFINQPGALNVIVFFTDGHANSIYANFPIKKVSDNNSRYDWSNFNSYNNYGPSPCTTGSTTVRGLLTSITATLDPTGLTAGLIDVDTASGYGISGGQQLPDAVNSHGCAFDNNSYGGWGPYNGRADIAYIPTADYDGNATIGTSYKQPDTYPNGNYKDQIRSDSPRAVIFAAMNAADQEAQKIRADTNYNIVTYTIGLSGNDLSGIDADFMERIANDVRATNYNALRPVGQYILASDNGSLADAFNAVASQILRLSK